MNRTLENYLQYLFTLGVALQAGIGATVLLELSIDVYSYAFSIVIAICVLIGNFGIKQSEPLEL